MTMAFRRALFLLSAAAFFLMLVWGLRGLQPFGHYPGPYGDVVTEAAPQERQILNVVTAIMFDYRGFDTIGEELILFAAVTGVILLLRREEPKEPISPRLKERVPPGLGYEASDAVRLLSLVFIGLTFLFGMYVIIQAHLSLGGGFQGGVVVAAAFLLIPFACSSDIFHKIAPRSVGEFLESVGAALYILIGFAAFFAHRPFLTNIFPLGKAGNLHSTGGIFLINLAVGIEVSAGFIVLIGQFLHPLEKLPPRR